MSRRSPWRIVIADGQPPIRDVLFYCNQNNIDHKNYSMDARNGRCQVTVQCSRLHWKNILGIVEGRV